MKPQELFDLLKPPPTQSLECVYVYDPLTEWKSFDCCNNNDQNNNDQEISQLTKPLNESSVSPQLYPASQFPCLQHNNSIESMLSAEINSNPVTYTTENIDENYGNIPFQYNTPLHFSEDSSLGGNVSPISPHYFDIHSQYTNQTLSLKIPTYNTRGVITSPTSTPTSALTSNKNSPIGAADLLNCSTGFKQLTTQEIEIEIEKINELYKTKLSELQSDPLWSFNDQLNTTSIIGLKKPRKKRFDKILLKCPVEGCPYEGLFKTVDYAKRHIREQHGGLNKMHICHGVYSNGKEWGCKKTFKRLYQLHNHWKRKKSQHKCKLPYEVALIAAKQINRE